MKHLCRELLSFFRMRINKNMKKKKNVIQSYSLNRLIDKFGRNRQIYRDHDKFDSETDTITHLK